MLHYLIHFDSLRHGLTNFDIMQDYGALSVATCFAVSDSLRGSVVGSVHFVVFPSVCGFLLACPALCVALC